MHLVRMTAHGVAPNSRIGSSTQANYAICMRMIEMGTNYMEVVDMIHKVKREQERLLANCEPAMHQYYGARIGVLTELLERIERLY